MTRKRYDEDFKKQLVKIYNQGNHSYRNLADEYGVAGPTIRHWVIRDNKSNSFDIDDNRTEEEKELIELRKKVKQLDWIWNDLSIIFFAYTYIYKQNSSRYSLFRSYSVSRFIYCNSNTFIHHISTKCFVSLDLL